MKRLLTIASILALAGIAHSAGIVWSAADSATNTNWSNNGNWVGGTAPGTTDTAVFDATGGTKAPTIDVSPSVAAVRIASTYNRAWSLSGQTLTCAAGFSDDGPTGAKNYGNGITCNGASATFHVGAVGTVTATACSLSLNGTTGMVLDDDKGLSIAMLRLGAAAVVTSSGAQTTTFNSATPLVFVNGGTLTINRGMFLTLTTTGSNITITAGTPTIVGNAVLSLSANNGVTSTIPNITLGGTLGLALIQAATTSAVAGHVFGGNVTTLANVLINATAAGRTLNFNSAGYALSCATLSYGSLLGTTNFKWGSSTITTTGAVNGTALNTGTCVDSLQTSKWIVGGSYTQQSTHTVVPGTSRIAFANAAKSTWTSNNLQWRYDFIDSATTGQIDSLADSLTAHDFIIKSGKIKGLSNGLNLSGNFTLANTCSDSIFAHMALHRWMLTGASPTLTLQGTGARLLDSAQWVPQKSLYVVMDSNNTIKRFVPVRDTAPQVWTMQASRTLTVLAAADSSWSGTATQYDTLRSSTPGGAATIAIPGVKRDAYLYVKDITLTGYTDTCLTCIDGGGNTGFVFGSTCSTTTLIRAPTQTAVVGVAITPMVHSWTGATPDSIRVRTALPAGLTAHAATGSISGTPTDTTSMMGIKVVGYACIDSSIIWDSLQIDTASGWHPWGFFGLW
jgi:hypothetical protein